MKMNKFLLLIFMVFVCSGMVNASPFPHTQSKLPLEIMTLGPDKGLCMENCVKIIVTDRLHIIKTLGSEGTVKSLHVVKVTDASVDSVSKGCLVKSTQKDCDHLVGNDPDWSSCQGAHEGCIEVFEYSGYDVVTAFDRFGNATTTIVEIDEDDDGEDTEPE